MDYSFTAQTVQLTHKFFDKNWNRLDGVAKNICDGNNKYNKKDLLLSELAEYIYNHQVKLKDVIFNNELEPWCVAWLTNQVKWNKTQFKKINIIDYDITTVKHDPTDEEDDYELYLEKEFELQNKINHINAAYNSLNWNDKRLFDLYFREFNSLQKLADYLGISKSGAKNMVDELKRKLNNYVSIYN